MNLTALLNYESQSAEGSVVVGSLRRVLHDFFVQVAASIVITVACRAPHAERYYRAIVQRLCQGSGADRLLVQLVYVDYLRPRRRVAGKRLHNLLLVDSYEAFLAADIAYYTQQYNTNEYYYIHLHLVDGEEVEDEEQGDEEVRLAETLRRIFAYCWRHMLINCSVQALRRAGGGTSQVRLYTYYPYTAAQCGGVAAAPINAYNGEAARWQHAGASHFFPAKVDNLHGCRLRVMVRHTPPFVELRNGNDTTGPVGGLEGRMLAELAAYMNFSTTIQLMEIDDRTMNFCCGIIAALLKNQTDMTIGYFRLRELMMNVSTSIFPYSMSSLVSAVHRNAHNLTAWQKLLYPFDRASWCCTGAAVLLSYGSALGLQRRLLCSGGGDGGMLGTGRKLWLSVAATFLGVPLSAEPRHARNRLLFGSVLWMSLVLRSIYAALLFNLYRTDAQQTLPDTTLALQRGRYEAVLINYTLMDVTKLPNYGGYKQLHWTVLYDSDETSAYSYVEAKLAATAAPQRRRYVVVAAKEYLMQYVQQRRRPGVFHIVREHLHYQHFTAYVRKHSHLSRQLDGAVLRLNEVGLIEKWRQRLLDDRYLHSRHLYGPQTITQRDLNAIYAVAAALHLGAVLVFAAEVRARRNARLRALFDCIQPRGRSTSSSSN